MLPDDFSNRTAQTYLAIASIIEGIENRLKFIDIGYILINVIVFFPTVFFTYSTLDKSGETLIPIGLLFIFCCHVVGISVNTYWVTSSMRLQLKLKLRYFQARYLERKLNMAGESIFSDESAFFNPEIGAVKSPDGKETTMYPTHGPLRMDGFVGAAKPRTLSLLLPFVFFVIYLASFLSILIYGWSIT